MLPSLSLGGGISTNYYKLSQKGQYDGFASQAAVRIAERKMAYAEASIRIASEKLNESKRMLAKMKRLYELGEKGRPDVVQMESQVAEDEYNLTHQENVAKQSLLALKSTMNFPVDEELKLAALTKTQKKSLESGMLKESEKEAGSQSVEPNGTENRGADEKETLVLPVNYETVYQGFQNISPDLKSAEYDGGISTNYYKNLSQKGQYDGFASQFRNNQGEYLALTLSIPIYNSDRWHSVKKARNDWQLAQVNLEETRRKLHDQIAQAVMDAEGYAKELHQMQKKVASDSLAYHMSSRKFEEGMLSTFDLHTAAQTLLESRIKELQMQMLLIIKQRLIAYYQGEELVR